MAELSTFIVNYRYVPEMESRRTPHREEHLAWLRGLAEQGLILLAGALQDPVDSAVLVVRAQDPYGAQTLLASRVFWGALTVLDPLAALLLWVRPRWGLALTLGIIACDVLHNSFYVAAHGQWTQTFYLSQLGFLLAVLVLSPSAWHGLRNRRRSVG